MRIYPPKEYYGIIVLRLKKQDKMYVLEICGRLIQLLLTESVTGSQWIVDEKRIRIRQ